jgi:cysteine desulfurase family protein (TIGR01976 family)
VSPSRTGPVGADIAPTEEIRSAFPALAREHAGYPVAYFDGPGGTQVPSAVLRACEGYLVDHNANTHWHYPSSTETDAVLARARDVFAGFFGCSDREVVFGANMTTLTYHLSRALGQAWGPGDEIVVTQLDHQANQACWRALEAERGVTVHTVPMTVPDGQIDWGEMERVTGARTRLIAFGAASNALGTINDVPRAASLARSVGARLFVDAVHFAPHAAIDVKALGCDFLACSAYKFYGPHIGVLYIEEGLGSEITPPRLPCAGAHMPERWETGTLNHEGIAGAAASVDFIAGLSKSEDGLPDRLRDAFEGLHARGSRLLSRLWVGLESIDGVDLYGPRPGSPRTPTVAFRLAGVPSALVAEHLAAEWGVFLSHGHFYATGVTEALGLEGEGLVRAGCACYTTVTEVERLLEGVEQLASR